MQVWFYFMLLLNIVKTDNKILIICIRKLATKNITLKLDRDKCVICLIYLILKLHIIKTSSHTIFYMYMRYTYDEVFRKKNLFILAENKISFIRCQQFEALGFNCDLNIICFESGFPAEKHIQIQWHSKNDKGNFDFSVKI